MRGPRAPEWPREPGDVEARPEQVRHPIAVAVGVCAVGREPVGLDAHRQARPQNAMQAATVPAAGGVVAERPEPEGRALEVVGAGTGSGSFMRRLCRSAPQSG